MPFNGLQANLLANVIKINITVKALQIDKERQTEVL